MKKLSLIMAVLMAIGLFAGCAQQENAEQLPGDEEAPAKEYQYITADEVKTMIYSLRSTTPRAICLPPSLPTHIPRIRMS